MGEKILKNSAVFCIAAAMIFLSADKKISDLFNAISIALALIYYFKYKAELDETARKYIKCIAIFFGAMLIAALFNFDAAVLKEYWRELNKALPFFAALFAVRGKKDCKLVLAAILTGIMVNDIYGLYGHLENLHEKRTWGLDNSFINLGYYLMIFFIINLSLFLKADKMQERLGYGILFIFMLMSVLFNGTRAVWLYLACVSPVVIFLLSEHKKRALAIIVGLIFVVSVAAGNIDSLNKRAASFQNNSDKSNQGHYRIVRDSLPMVKDNIFVGVGLGRFKIEFDKYISDEQRASEGVAPHAHNNFVNIAAESGIFVCLAWCYMIGVFIWQMIKDFQKYRRKETLALLSITLGMVICGMVESTFDLRQFVKMYFCMLGMYLNYRTLFQEKIKIPL
jgi:O-antigen ligase